ncbi:hypothetical protein C2I18_24280 [Paenibacillus sp. PK3_47]|uniref:hypothetical protein n=1 Tax=Paenibacillus sp. PK3_47 TaxID=2072642 RepID=UPI00201DF705|nr:hypothetical protein [Paenibacillus sp. PK3_47]UQZ36371.1 hypothetical protein C2I18_24280 [Paenibacillus sp. PK3_47]
MSNRISRITVFTAAVMLSLAPAAAYGDSSAGTITSPAESSVQSGKGHHPHPHQARGFRAGGHFIVNETARLLEMDRAELVTSLKNGKTLYAIAKEKKGWTEDQYIQKLSEAAGRKLDDSLQKGQLNPDELKKLKAGLPALLKLSIESAAQSRTGSQTGHPSGEKTP